MIILTGDTRSKKMIEQIQSLGWGRMFVQQKFIPYPNEPWGFDNGAYYWWKQGKCFDDGLFYQRLKKAYQLGVPYMAICPDIYQGGVESLYFSLDYYTHVLPRDWPWYIAVQDGIKIDDIRPHLHKFAGIFLGGSISFKKSANEWCSLAHDNGKKFHYGIINHVRLQYAMEIGADSADGTGMLWEKNKMTRFIEAYEFAKLQGNLFSVGGS